MLPKRFVGNFVINVSVASYSFLFISLKYYNDSTLMKIIFVADFQERNQTVCHISPGGYFGVKGIGMTVGNPRKLP